MSPVQPDRSANTVHLPLALVYAPGLPWREQECTYRAQSQVDRRALAMSAAGLQGTVFPVEA
jgi:hypothetical protein